MTLSATLMDAQADGKEVAIHIVETQRPLAALATKYRKQWRTVNNITPVEH